MNAKYTLQIIDRSIADASAGHPIDVMARTRLFVLLLSNEFKACGEPLGDRLAELVENQPSFSVGVA